MKTYNTKEERILANHIAENKGFENACITGNAESIRSIVTSEMEKANLYTEGASKLRDTVFRLLQGKPKVSMRVGLSVMEFIWNSRLSAAGLAVVN